MGAITTGKGSEAYCAAEVATLAAALEARGWSLVTAESCTGGWLAKILTDLAGSSVWFERGFVTYSNAAKCEMLGVSEALLESEGAVSEAVAVAMAAGAYDRSPAQLAIALTGIAGPGGGTAGKPVGTVCYAVAMAGRTPHGGTWHFTGERDAVRWQTVCAALDLLIRAMRH